MSALPRLLSTVLLLVLLVLSGCSSPEPNRDPTGERFPTLSGTSLDGTAVSLPEAYAGRPVLLLVGYVMETQFDLDRWLIGLLQLETPVAVLELPTIDGMLPGMISGSIDAGMRRGIPSEDWGAVVTVYDDADRLVAFTGTENPRNGRVLLLDGDGVVRWFHDRGFSAGLALELDARARELLDQD